MKVSSNKRVPGGGSVQPGYRELCSVERTAVASWKGVFSSHSVVQFVLLRFLSVSLRFSGRHKLLQRQGSARAGKQASKQATTQPTNHGGRESVCVGCVGGGVSRWTGGWFPGIERTDAEYRTSHHLGTWQHSFRSHRDLSLDCPRHRCVSSDSMLSRRVLLVVLVYFFIDDSDLEVD